MRLIGIADLSTLRPHPKNHRTPASVSAQAKQLAANIKADGYKPFADKLATPAHITVYALDDGTYRILRGHCRVPALQSLQRDDASTYAATLAQAERDYKVKGWPVLVIDRPATEREELEVMYGDIDSAQRELTKLERWERWREYVLSGVSQSDASVAVGRKPSAVFAAALTLEQTGDPLALSTIDAWKRYIGDEEGAPAVKDADIIALSPKIKEHHKAKPAASDRIGPDVRNELQALAAARAGLPVIRKPIPFTQEQMKDLTNFALSAGQRHIADLLLCLRGIDPRMDDGTGRIANYPMLTSYVSGLIVDGPTFRERFPLVDAAPAPAPAPVPAPAPAPAPARKTAPTPTGKRSRTRR